MAKFNLKNNKEEGEIPEDLSVFLDEETKEDYDDIRNRNDIIEFDKKDDDFIDENNISSYLADNFEEQDIETIQNSVGYMDEQNDEFEEEYNDYTKREYNEVIENIDDIAEEEIPEFNNPYDAVIWALNNKKVLKITYRTQGKKRRNTKKLKREVGLPIGASISRFIEPHLIFKAGTGNDIVVTYDRSVSAIRAFIIRNILSYVFTGKNVKNRLKINPVSNKGKIMKKKDNIKKLNTISNELKSINMNKTASVIKNSIKEMDDKKFAQYVGGQGYWIRNSRCWGNCYRSKRAENPNMPAQKVWEECLGEYKESLNDDYSGWEKYASKKEKNIDWIVTEKKAFIKDVDTYIKSGKSVGKSIFKAISDRNKKYSDSLIKNADTLFSLAGTLKKNGFEKLGGEIAESASLIIKEADFAQPKKWWGGRLWDKMRGRGKGSKDDVINRLKIMIQRIDEIIALYEGKGKVFSSRYGKIALAQVFDDPQAMQNKINTQSKEMSYPNPQTPDAKLTENANPQAEIPKKQDWRQLVRGKYHTFLKDLREELGNLGVDVSKSKDTAIKPIVTKMFQAATQFLNFSEKSLVSGSLLYKDVVPYLQQLKNTVLYAISGIEQVPETDENTAQEAEMSNFPKRTQENDISKPQEPIKEEVGASQLSPVDTINQQLNNLDMGQLQQIQTFIQNKLQQLQNPVSGTK
ncbi:MAG: hypothetical protein WC942_07925 [Clostridia bacterium]|jgi:hypothetical protein